MQDLVLFLTIAKKYEKMAQAAINRYIEYCQNPIKRIFLILEDDLNLFYLRELHLPYDYLTDTEAIKLLNLNTPEYACIAEDKWMAQQYFKLNCDILSGSDNCIITDCDGLLLKPIDYFTDGKLNLFYSELCFRKKALPTVGEFFFKKELPYYNFVTENVLFEKKYLVEVRELVGDFRQYRNSKHTLYDMSADDYAKYAGASYPEPTFTNYRLFHDKSFNNVIYSELTDFAKEDLLNYITPQVVNLNPEIWFSEYEVYNFYLLLNYPEKVNLVYTPIQWGFILETNPLYWLNNPTPAGREDSFFLMLNHSDILTKSG